MPLENASHRVGDVNGFVEIKDNPLSKVGVFEYGGYQIPGAPDSTAIYRVFRPAEELGDPACIESFKLQPWISGHVMLGPTVGTMSAEDKGVHGVIGEQVYFDGEFLRGNLKLFSEAMGELIDSGVNELSLGYRCRYEHAPGVWNGESYDYIQRDIRGNHLALVPEGRCGPEVAVLDHLVSTFDAKEFSQMAEEMKEAPAADAGVEEIKAALEQLKPLLSMVDDLKKLLGGAEEVKTEIEDEEVTAEVTAPDACDEEILAAMDARLKKLEKAEPAPVMDERAILRAAADRDALARDLSKHVGTFDHAAMTLADVAKYGVDKLGIKAEAGQEVPTLRGYLAAASTAMDATLVTGQRGKQTSGAIAGIIDGMAN